MKRSFLFFILSLLLIIPIFASQAITEDEAIRIAVNDSRVDNYTLTKVKLECEKGRPEYDISFIAGNMEYEYEIDGANGKILSFEREENKLAFQPKTAQMIDESEAFDIAAKHANVNIFDVRKKKIKQDFDDGMHVYEVKFKVNRTEYEYEIDASTGRILDYDID